MDENIRMPEGYLLAATNVTVSVPAIERIAYYAPSNGRHVVNDGYVTLTGYICMPCGNEESAKRLSKLFSGKKIAKRTLDRFNFLGYVFVASEIVG